MFKFFKLALKCITIIFAIYFFVVGWIALFGGEYPKAMAYTVMSLLLTTWTEEK